MQTIIKIAVVSVLSLFAIVGVVSISKAEETVWYCEMTELLEVVDGKVTNYQLQKFKFKVTPDAITFGSGGYFDNFVTPITKFFDDEMFYGKGEYSNFAFSKGFFNYSHTGYDDSGVTAITAKCDKF